MELGNLIYGHSRGNFPIQRGVGFEEELYRLFDAVNPERDNSWREYGMDVQNEVFSIFPYYWDDCSCGFEEKDYEWDEQHQHSSSCFMNKRKNYDQELEVKGIEMYSDEYIELIDTWAKENGWKDGFAGSGSYCDCGKHEAYETWRETNNHALDCPIVRPNFEYKPMNFQLSWYKYPLRDSYMSHELSLDEFKHIIDECIKHLNNQK